jgi:hypothetical protein
MKLKVIAVFLVAVVLIPVYATGAGLSQAQRAHYQALRMEIYEGYLSSRNYRNLRFYIAACLHDLSSLQWKACQTYAQKYGDCNAGVTNELYKLARSLMAQRGQGSGIQKIYDYVNRTIRYEAENKNVPRFPYETLYSRIGDCEDQAILLATLLRVVGYESALVRFADKQKDFYHVICVVKTDSREARTPLFRFGRYTSEGYTWKILDPSYNHSYYKLPEWLSRYRTRDGGYTFPAGVARILKINRNEYYDLCDQADQKGRYR